MARDSRIEWTDHTFNPWWGCTKVSPACANCYAEAWAKRTGFDIWSSRSPRRFLSESYWQQPGRWNTEAERAGHRFRVFCASMADVFEWRADLSPSRKRLWRLIELTPSLDWLLLTKRPHLVRRLVPWNDEWPHNVWLGTTIENQRWANSRLPHLAEIPAAVRFVSCEPLLGKIDLDNWLADSVINWVIAGGETGPGARPTDPTWFYSLRDQCLSHATPFHFKQWGDWAPIDTVTSSVPRSTFDKRSYSTPMGRFGKKTTGRALSGRTWDDIPSPSVKPNHDTLIARESSPSAGSDHTDSTFSFEFL